MTPGNPPPSRDVLRKEKLLLKKHRVYLQLMKNKIINCYHNKSVKVQMQWLLTYLKYNRSILSFYTYTPFPNLHYNTFLPILTTIFLFIFMSWKRIFKMIHFLYAINPVIHISGWELTVEIYVMNFHIITNLQLR